MRKLSFYCSLLLAFLFFIAPLLTFAQQGPAMDTMMVRNGKIYVVVAVLAVIFIGLLLFLINLERRLHRLEKTQDKQPAYTEQP